mmetsp:Transcript_22944/g.49965  ORF Transcript_22944/g.49965 Transcript_22944/m.49965 type:complete len:201 (-) Transcript_22944:513-1115(-)
MVVLGIQCPTQGHRPALGGKTERKSVPWNQSLLVEGRHDRGIVARQSQDPVGVLLPKESLGGGLAAKGIGDCQFRQEGLDAFHHVFGSQPDHVLDFGGLPGGSFRVFLRKGAEISGLQRRRRILLLLQFEPKRIERALGNPLQQAFPAPWHAMGRGEGRIKVGTGVCPTAFPAGVSVAGLAGKCHGFRAGIDDQGLALRR